MVGKRTLTIDDPTFAEFNRLKIKIAQSNSESRIPAISPIVSALIEIGNRHYAELHRLLAESSETEE